MVEVTSLELERIVQTERMLDTGLVLRGIRQVKPSITRLGDKAVMPTTTMTANP